MKAVAAAVALSMAGLAHAQSVQWFYSNFDSGQPAELTGAGGLEPVAGFAGAGNPGNVFTGNLWRNDGLSATTLTLTNLPGHYAISISFLLAFIDSWDSIDGAPAPDWFNLDIDGTNVLRITSANASGSVTYAGNQIFFGQAGWSSVWPDRAFDMGNEPLIQFVPHTASTLTLRFYASGAGYQSGLDESWAIDNLKVTVHIPSPGPAGLLFAGAFIAARRSRAPIRSVTAA